MTCININSSLSTTENDQILDQKLIDVKKKISKLKPVDIMEIKSMYIPPSDLLMDTEAVCIALGKKTVFANFKKLTSNLKSIQLYF